MRLSEENGKRFYSLFLPLLNFVNKKKGVNPNLRNMTPGDFLPLSEVKEIADVLWADIGLIDEYLEVTDGIAENDRKLIQSWKRRVSRDFVLERILKKGAIMISAEDDEVYQVSGIISTWDEIYSRARLPLMIQTTLIPFEDVIISDGLIMSYNFIIGGNMARGFKETYMEAKKNGTIHKQL